jgi:hypothetical protein
MSEEIANAVLGADTTAARLERLQREQTTEMERLTHLETLKKTQRLHKDQYIESLMLQDSITLRFKEIEQAEHQARLEQAQADAQTALEAHDLGVPLLQDVAQEFTGLLVALFHCGQRFQAVYDSMTTPLMALSNPDGQPAFDIIAPRSALERLVAGLPQGSHLLLYLFEQTSHAPTVGECRRAMDPVPGLQPFSQRAMQRYLARFTEEDPT